jgi:hypothetical protein
VPTRYRPSCLVAAGVLKRLHPGPHVLEGGDLGQDAAGDVGLRLGAAQQLAAWGIPGACTSGHWRTIPVSHGTLGLPTHLRCAVRLLLERPLGDLQHQPEPLLDRRGDAAGHLRGGVPVVGPHGAAALLAGAAGRLVPHQLVDHPGRDAGVLQPGREGVPKVVRAAQVHGRQERVASRWQRQPPLLGALTDAGDQVGRQELAQGDLDGGWPNGPATLGEHRGELAGGLRAPGAERLERAGGGRPQRAGGVGQLGDRGVVGAVEVVARQHGAGALWHPGPALAARAAAGTGEHQRRRVAAGWQLAADGIDHQRGQGQLADVVLDQHADRPAEPALASASPPNGH